MFQLSTFLMFFVSFKICIIFAENFQAKSVVKYILLVHMAALINGHNFEKISSSYKARALTFLVWLQALYFLGGRRQSYPGEVTRLCVYGEWEIREC